MTIRGCLSCWIAICLRFSPWYLISGGYRCRVDTMPLISCKNTKKAKSCWTTIDRRMLEPTKKDTLHPRAKEKPQQMVRGAIAFKIRPHIRQRCLEGTDKPCVHQGGGKRADPVGDWDRHDFDCLRGSCRGMSQQWPAMGTKTLATAILEGTVCA